MARNRSYTAAEGRDELEGTVEGLARDHFEREKAAYEARTGQKVEFVPPMPVTRTPISAAAETQPDEPAKFDKETQSEGEE